jgi:hypothetical protein
VDSAKATVADVVWLDRYQVGAPQTPEIDTLDPGPPVVLDTLSWYPHLISENSQNVVLAAFEVTNGGDATDVLREIELYSYMQHAFSFRNIKVYHRHDGTEILKKLKSITGSRFEENAIQVLDGFEIQFGPGEIDTVIIKMDVFTDSVRYERLFGTNEFDGEGCAVAIMPGGLSFDSDPGGWPAAGDTLQPGWQWDPEIPDGFWVAFDTAPPDVELHVWKVSDYWTDYLPGGTIWGEMCEDLTADLHLDCRDTIPPDDYIRADSASISLGDSIFIWATFPVGYNEVYYDSINKPTIEILNGNWGAFVDHANDLTLLWADTLWEIAGGTDSVGIDINGDTDLDDFYLNVAYREHRIPFPLEDGTDEWDDCIADDATVRLPTDLDDNYPLVVNANDLAQNTGVDTFWFCQEVDTKKPIFDSVTVELVYDPRGDGVVSVGDSLSVTAWMECNPPLEVRNVWLNIAHYLDPGVESDSIRVMEDISPANNNTRWRYRFELPGPVDDMDSTTTSNPTFAYLKDIYLLALDDACNPETTHVRVTNVVDLQAPSTVSAEYKLRVDDDGNFCANFGDTISVKMRLEVPDDTDIDSVFADFIDAGLNRDARVLLYDDGATGGDSISGDNLYTRIYGLSFKDSVTAIEPLPQDAKDINGWPPGEEPDGYDDFTVMVTAVDVHGNRTTRKLNLVDENNDSAGVTIDTKRPEKITPGVLNAYPIGGAINNQGKVKITFDKNHADVDASIFHVFEVTGAAWSDTEVGVTTVSDTFPDPNGDTVFWTSEYYDDGTQLTFGIRTEDDCGNWEFNNNVLVSVIADGRPAQACFIYPEPPNNGAYGPQNPLAVTALIRPDVSGLAQARLAFRLVDIDANPGNGITPGPWRYSTPWGDTIMTRPAGGTILYDTLNIGNNIQDAGEWEMVIVTVDSAGNELIADTAYAWATADSTCAPLVFTWHLDDNYAYFVDINGNVSPGIEGCFPVTRDTLNQATVSLSEFYEDSLYQVDAWVIIEDATGDTRDSVRVHYEGGVTLPFTFDFSVFDWPKTYNLEDISTSLHVRIKDLRSGGEWQTNADLCVPDEDAPDAYWSYPYNCQRLPIAQTTLDSIPLIVRVNPLSYDDDNPIRAEFFYVSYDMTDTVKIGERGWNPTDMAFILPWNNTGMDEGWYWLYATVYD